MKRRVGIYGIGVSVSLVVACGGATKHDDASTASKASDAGVVDASGIVEDSGRGDTGPGDPNASDPGASARSATSSVQCGAVACSGAHPICCRNGCVATMDECEGDALLCDDQQDCATGVCCRDYQFAQSSQGVTLGGSSCRSSCVTNNPRAQMCASATECQNSKTCEPDRCLGGRYCENISGCE